jgi:pimeloyl-ACP methyl ester carboxylesterase
MRFRCFAFVIFLAFAATGCGNFFAHRMVQSPNTYPTWLAPRARVELAFHDKYITNFPAHFLEVGPPPARLRYRIIEPANYQFVSTFTNWVKRGHPNFRFSFTATVPGETNAWTASPRGTVMLLHGYGVGEFAMSPWALRLAQEGWRCVILDLRGHGKSTGRRIYFGVQEAKDLSQLLDALGHNHELAKPVHAIGDSYGAALALRWKVRDPRLSNIVSMSPYPHLSNAVVNICLDYAKWLSPNFLNAGIEKVPRLLQVAPDALDTVTLVRKTPVKALFVAGGKDDIVPIPDVKEVRDAADSGSQLIIVPNASHESLPYFFDELANPVVNWLADEKNSLPPALSGNSPP